MSRCIAAASSCGQRNSTTPAAVCTRTTVCRIPSRSDDTDVMAPTGIISVDLVDPRDTANDTPIVAVAAAARPTLERPNDHSTRSGHTTTSAFFPEILDLNFASG